MAKVIEGTVTEIQNTWGARNLFVVEYMDPKKVRQMMSEATIWSEAVIWHDNQLLPSRLEIGDRVRVVCERFGPVNWLMKSMNVLED